MAATADKPCGFYPVVIVYLLIALIVYIIMCRVIGHTDWILSVLFQNTASDLSGQIPRSLGAQIDFSTTDLPDTFVATIWMELPGIIQFTCIDGVVRKKIKHRGFLNWLFLFISGYVFQALIAVSWAFATGGASTPEEVVSYGPWVFIIVGLVISFFAVVIVSGVSKKAEEFTDAQIVPRLGALVGVWMRELIKAIILIIFFGVVISGLRKVGIQPSGFFAAVLFVLINQMLVKVTDYTVDDWFDFKPDKAGERFCFWFQIGIMVMCFIVGSVSV